jgi:hypothetical protein
MRRERQEFRNAVVICPPVYALSVSRSFFDIRRSLMDVIPFRKVYVRVESLEQLILSALNIHNYAQHVCIGERNAEETSCGSLMVRARSGSHDLASTRRGPNGMNSPGHLYVRCSLS